MNRYVVLFLPLALAACSGAPPAAPVPAPSAARFVVSLPAERSTEAQDGRLLLLISADSGAEPRFQISDGAETQLVFGTDVEGWKPGEEWAIPDTAPGYPVASLRDVPPGSYRVQVLLNRYETYTRADGHTVKLPPDRGEGQQWNRKPGNFLSEPRTVRIAPGGVVRLSLDREIPDIAPPADTHWVKHVRIRSQLLSEFWGRDVFLGAHVLLPKGWAEHPRARYPLAVFHGHFPADFGGFRTEPPDSQLVCEPSERFHLPCYNRTEQEYAYGFYREWSGPDFPRMLIVEIQHPNPFYDDSYAVNSANLGPYGDAIVRELIPEIERRFRGIGAGWARFLYGGSTGGWEALAQQVFYPDEFNGAFAACPDPIDFRAYTVVNLYRDRNAYHLDSRWKRTPRPGRRDYLGQVGATLEEMNRREAVLGSRGRSGDQWDIWQAVYGPVGEDGYPRPIWDKRTGEIDSVTAAYWREHYDLGHILRRDWATLGPKLRGKIHLYVGDMDTYYLNDAVYLVEDFLRGTTDPPFAGEVRYGDRAEHCWNGDPTRPNAISRLRYNEMYVDKILERIRRTAPPGADTTSWRYR